MRLCKAYKTDVLSMTMLGQTVVILNTYDLIKEYFQKRKYLKDRTVEEAIFKVYDKDFGGEVYSLENFFGKMHSNEITTFRRHNSNV